VSDILRTMPKPLSRPALSQALLLILALPALLAGCTVTDPLYCDQAHECTDPDRPFCDLNGEHPASDGVARTCIPDPNAGSEDDGSDDGADDGDDGGGDDADSDDNAEPVACSQPGEALECADDTLVLCSEESIEDRIECPMGCSSEELRCLDIRASNDLSAYLDQAGTAEPLELTGVAELNTDSGNLLDEDGNQIQVRTLLLEAPVGGVPIRLIIAGRVDLESLRAIGDAALAIVAEGDVIVRGRLSVASDFNYGGAGRRAGNFACAGNPGSAGDVDQQGGNGGGGHRTAGGRGGSIGEIGTGGDGGEPTPNPDLIPLVGGCDGYGDRGRGGGAVQIASGTRIDLPPGSLVNANGSGGDHGTSGPGKEFPPGDGGGAGGGILLEAPQVSVEGGLFANGGGGAGRGIGENGREDQTPAAGSNSTDARFGDGGQGGAALSEPTDGESLQPSSSDGRVGGSGGGSAGYIRVNTRDSIFVPTPTALISPPVDVGTAGSR
jgi:hypothetical protein